jgi:uncharacterized protein YjdB
VITVEDRPIASITIVPASLSLAVGESSQLAADIRDAAGVKLDGRTVSWSSSDITIATISASGTVIALAVGTTTVTAQSEGVRQTATITVHPTAVNTVALLPAQVSLVAGNSCSS